MIPHITAALRAEMAGAARKVWRNSPIVDDWPPVVDAVLSRLPSGAWPAVVTEEMIYATAHSLAAQTQPKNATSDPDWSVWMPYMRAALEAALAAAPKEVPVRTAAGDALAQAVEWRLKIGGVVWGGLASAVEAYRAAEPEPWAREQVEGLVRAAKTLVQYGEWTIGPESLSHHPTLPSAVAQARAALRPFATIADPLAPERRKGSFELDPDNNEENRIGSVPQQETGKSAGVASGVAAPAAGAPARRTAFDETSTYSWANNELLPPAGAPASDPRLAAIAAWRDGRFIGKAQEAAAAIHDILSDLLAAARTERAL